jgi:hypothetical protein
VPKIPDLNHNPLDYGSQLETVIGSTSGWPRAQRHALGVLLFAGYLVLAQFRAGFLGLFLAVAFYGTLQRWVVEEPRAHQIADAYIWAGLTASVVLGAVAIWLSHSGPEWLQTWATHVWFPLGVVAVALALDRVRRRATPAESIGQAFSRGPRRAKPEDPASPGSPGAEA